MIIIIQKVIENTLFVKIVRTIRASGVIWGRGQLGHLPQSSIYINFKSAHLPHALSPVNL